MKKVVIGMVIGLLIGSASTAVAANTESVQAVLQKFNFKINGETKAVKTTPLVVDGTSYLPVRELAGLLGYNVDFDGSTETIILDQTPAVKAKESAKVEANEKREKLTDINKEEWVMLQDIRERFGIIYIPKSNGTDVITKGDITFKIPKNLEPYGVGVYTDNGVSIGIKTVGGYIHFKIEDLKASGFIQ